MNEDEWLLLAEAWRRGCITLGQAEELEAKFRREGGAA